MKKGRLKVTTIPPMSMKLLPPKEGACQECAREHHPENPHDAQSLYYQVKFKMQHGRSATWNDAMAHCKPEIQEQWWTALADWGITKENGKVRP